MEYMEAQMQRQYDAWDAQMSAADADLKAYVALMRNPDALDAFIAIEKAWDLFGYTPEIVCAVLSAVAGGLGLDAAIDAAINGTSSTVSESTEADQSNGLNQTPSPPLANGEPDAP